MTHHSMRPSIWLGKSLFVVLACLLVLTNESSKVYADWRAYISITYIGNTEVELQMSIGDDKVSNPSGTVKGELYRDGVLLTSFNGFGPNIYTDSGLQQAVTYTYLWKAYLYDPNQQTWQPLAQQTITATTGQVSGIIRGSKTWSGGTWTCIVNPPFSSIYLLSGATLNIAPGTTVENCIIRSDYPDAHGTVNVNGAILRGVKFPGEGNSWNGLTTLSIRNSKLFTITAEVAALPEFSGNSGSCGTETLYGGHFASRFTLPLNQIVVRENQMQTCTFAASRGGTSGREVPNQVIVEDNTLQAITLYGNDNGASFQGGVSVVRNDFSKTVTIARVTGALNVDSNYFRDTLALGAVVSSTSTSGINRFISYNAFRPSMGSTSAGIQLGNVNDTRIAQNTIDCSNGFFSSGILLNSPSSNNEVLTNTIRSCGQNIFLYADFSGLMKNNLVRANTISASGPRGFGVELAYQVTNSKVEGNTITCAGDGTVGIQVDSGNPNNNELVGNTVTNCNYGIYLSAAMTNTIHDNIVVSNTYNIGLDANVKNNTIYNNIFRQGPGTQSNWDLDELGCAQVACPNTWNVGKRVGPNIVGGPYIGGNYWSDYTGRDTDGDLLGNTPYTLTRGFTTTIYNVDNLPLVSPPLTLTEAVAPFDHVLPGQWITYTLNLYWAGPGSQPLTTGFVQSDIPIFTVYVDGSLRANVDNVRYESDIRAITWLGDVPDQTTVNIEFVVKVKCPYASMSNADFPNQIRSQVRALFVDKGTFTEYTANAQRDVPLVKPDLQISGLEVAQVVQNLNGDMRLIEGRSTSVRLYLKAQYPNDEVPPCLEVPDVTAQLSGGPGAPLAPTNSSVEAIVSPDAQRPTYTERRTLSKTLHWNDLPSSWLSGAYTIMAELNPNCERVDRDCTNNKFQRSVSFVPSPQLIIRLYPIQYSQSPKLLPTLDTLEQEVRHMLALYPVKSIKLKYYVPITTKSLDSDTLLALLDKERPWVFSDAKNTVYVGYLHEDLVTGATQGSAWLEKPVSWVKRFVNDRELTGWVFAHEIGHNLGRHHVNCPQGVPADLDPNWPYGFCRANDFSRDGYLGWDARSDQVVDLFDRSDIMSYGWLGGGVPAWVSDYTYNAFYQKLNTGVNLRQVAPSQGERLLISGVITPAVPTATMDYVYRFTNPYYQDASGGVSYTLQLQDITGRALVTDTFSADPEMAASAAIPYQRALPYFPQAARVVLKRGATVLATRVASANPPTVTVTYPNGGETLSGTVTLAWRASDADGDALEYAVQYSADGGATWQPVVVGWTVPTYTVDMTRLPGGTQALLRVAASDGFYTAYGQSNGVFSVPRQRPTVLMLSPLDASEHVPGRPVVLSGYAFDQGLHDITGTSLTWTSDRDGVLGTGEQIEVSTLSRGLHTLTLTATDSQGLTGTSSVQVNIGLRVWLPIIAR